jgi:hypothetical protein
MTNYEQALRNVIWIGLILGFIDGLLKGIRRGR